jgi:hypothetical protein
MASRDTDGIRRKLLEDPNTRRIAETLGLPVDEYVQYVVDFATTPGSEPQFVALPEAELKKMGAPQPPSLDEMTSHVREAVKILDGRTRSSFEDSSPAKRKA